MLCTALCWLLRWDLCSTISRVSKPPGLLSWYSQLGGGGCVAAPCEVCVQVPQVHASSSAVCAQLHSQHKRNTQAGS